MLCDQEMASSNMFEDDGQITAMSYESYIKVLFCNQTAETQEYCEQNQNHTVQRFSLDTGKAYNWGQPHMVKLHLSVGLGEKKKDEEFLNSGRDMLLQAKYWKVIPLDGMLAEWGHILLLGSSYVKESKTRYCL